MVRKASYILWVCMVIISGCTLFKKSITKPITISFNESSLKVIIDSTATFVKYANHNSIESLRQEFLESFKKEGNNTANINFVDDPLLADYILELKTVTITESSFIQKIEDPKSAYNGKSMVLNKVECYAEVDIINVKNKNEKPLKCFNTKERTEKETNNRNLDDLITGSNKNNTNYRTKLLSDNIGMQLTGDVGRRIWLPITRKIVKADKK